MDKVNKSLSRALHGKGAFDVHGESSENGEREQFFTLTDDDFEETTDENLKWRYKEAAIYINEGFSGANFKHHPTTPKAINAYLLVHNTWLRIFDLVACIIILCMAFFERPAVVPEFSTNKTRIYVTTSIELVCYAYLLVVGWIRYRWLGWKQILREKRSFMYVIIVLALLDVIFVLALPYQFYRFSRMFRPIYIINNHYSSGTRRVILDILRSAQEIIDVFVMTITFIFVFSLLGFYLFFNPQHGQYIQLDQDWYFRDLGVSFVSFFICLTTANFPDTMLPAYKTIGHSATIYFVVFCLIGIYFLQNLFLAAIYSSFNENSRNQFKNIFLSARRGLRLAFDLIDTDRTGQMTFSDFRALMKYYSSSIPLRNIVLMFKLMDENGEGTISMEEFYEFPSVSSVDWDSDEMHDQFFIFDYDSLPEFLKPFATKLHWFVTWVYFQWIVNLVILSNTIWLLIKAVTADRMVATEGGLKSKEYLEVLHVVDYVFIGFYVVETITRMIGLGWNRFIKSTANLVDFLIIAGAVCGAVLSTGRVGNPLSYLVFLRLFLILRFIDFRLKLTVAMETIGMILPKMVSFILVITYMYYVFAVIGMEAFAYKNSRCGCTMVHHYSNITVDSVTSTTTVKPYGDFTYGCSDDQFYNIAGNTTVFYRDINDTLTICTKKSTDECIQSKGIDCDCSIKSCGGHYSGSYDRTSQDGLYYLMNFDNIVNAYITLFALMVVNNWQVIMFGTVDATGTTWSVMYFVFFYFIAVEVVVNVVQAFILDAFNKLTPTVEGHIQQRNKGKNSKDIEVIEIPISKNERKLIVDSQSRAWYSLLSAGYLHNSEAETKYTGRRSLNSFDIFMLVYEDDLLSWLSEEGETNTSHIHEATVQFRPGKSQSIHSDENIELSSTVSRNDHQAKELESLRAEIKHLRKELSSYRKSPSDRPRSPNSTIRRSQIDVVSASPDGTNRMPPERGPHPPPRRISRQENKLQDLV